MTIARIKTVTHRIKKRFGTTEDAAAAAGVWKSQWSDWENPDKPGCTIPLGKLIELNLTSAERRLIASMFADDEATGEADPVTEAGEAVETAAELHKMVRLASVNGITETEARPIRAKALETIVQAGDVLKALG